MIINIHYYMIALEIPMSQVNRKRRLLSKIASLAFYLVFSYHLLMYTEFSYDIYSVEIKNT